MKLYDTRTAPNPRRVRVFLAEKGIEIPDVQQIDLGRLEQKGEEFSRINPVQRTPALELDDGTILTESIAICRYFEELQPSPPLMGTDAKSKALVEMWQRRIELHFLMPVAMAFRHTHPEAPLHRRRRIHDCRHHGTRCMRFHEASTDSPI